MRLSRFSFGGVAPRCALADIAPVNYSTVLGGAAEYGIVADKYVQANHIQTNFAVNTYTNGSGGSEQVVQPDLSGEHTVPFIAGTIIGKLRFANHASAGEYDVLTSEESKDKITNDGTTKVVITSKSQDEVQGKVNTLISGFSAKSNQLADEKATVQIDDAAITNNYTLDLTGYDDNANIYVTVASNSNLARVIRESDSLGNG